MDRGAMGTRLLHQRNCWSCKWELASSNVQGLVPQRESVCVYRPCRLAIFNFIFLLTTISDSRYTVCAAIIQSQWFISFQVD